MRPLPLLISRTFISENMVDFFNNRANVDRLVNILSEVDYLVLNHFGNEEISELSRSAITMPLLSARDSQGKATIILSSIDLNELEVLHQSGKNNQVRARQLIEIIRDNIKSSYCCNRSQNLLDYYLISNATRTLSTS